MAGLQAKQKARVQTARQTQVSTPIATEQVSGLARAGKHAKAIELATTALAAAGLTVARKLDLLDLRAESLLALQRTIRPRRHADQSVFGRGRFPRHSQPGLSQRYRATGRKRLSKRPNASRRTRRKGAPQDGHNR